MTKTKSIGLNDYEAVEYTSGGCISNGGRISYVLLFRWAEVGTTYHPSQGHCRRQIGGKFRSIGEAFHYASLVEKKAALEFEARRSRRLARICEREAENLRYRAAKMLCRPVAKCAV